jgi:hypothetical protein
MASFHIENAVLWHSTQTEPIHNVHMFILETYCFFYMAQVFFVAR